MLLVYNRRAADYEHCTVETLEALSGSHGEVDLRSVDLSKPRPAKPPRSHHSSHHHNRAAANSKKSAGPKRAALGSLSGNTSAAASGFKRHSSLVSRNPNSKRMRR